MNELMEYDITKIPPIFALKNNSNLCYLNSLIQSLLSCSAFNEAVVNEKREIIINNKTIQEIIDLITKPINKSARTIRTYDVYKLFSYLMTAKNKAIRFQYGRQEDAYEGLLLLLDTLGMKYDLLFHNRYKSQMHCTVCKHNVFPGRDDACEIVIEIGDDLNTKKSIEEHIKQNISYPEDYTCEKCKVRNAAKSRHNIYRINTLSRVSEVLILLFKKYVNKSNIYFPKTLDFQGTNNNRLNYRIVAQIEHFGNMYGGHYQTRCLRPKPEGFHQDRIDYGKKMITQLSMNPIINQTRINSAKRMIEYDTNCIKNAETLGVFLFNDSRVSYMPEGFQPTPETYMVFYHLINKK